MTKRLDPEEKERRKQWRKENLPCRACGVVDRLPSGRCKPCWDASREKQYEKYHKEGLNKNPMPRRSRKDMPPCEICGDPSQRYQIKCPTCKLKKQEQVALEWQRNEYFLQRIRNGKLKPFGITAFQYDFLWTKQRGVCYICLEPEKSKHHGHKGSNKTSMLAVDHDHKTGKIRGLVCGKCNRGIGFFQDDSELLAFASRYVDFHG